MVDLMTEVMTIIDDGDNDMPSQAYDNNIFLLP